MRDVDAHFQVFSLDSADAKVRTYRKRKIYSKTTSGCLACKSRRVKCDESTPTCSRCRRNRRSCTYELLSEHQHQQRSRHGLERNNPALSVLSALTVDPYCSPSARNGTPSMHLMQHFHAHGIEILHLPRIDPILALARSQPLLHTTLLALAAAHLRHSVPARPQHGLAEHFHQHLALHAYRRALAVPAAQHGPGGVDALLLSAALLNLLAFALPATEPPADPSVSWVFRPQPDRLGWLALQAGLWSLLLSTDAYRARAQTFLNPLFLGDHHAHEMPAGVREGLENMPTRWIQIFGLNDARRDAVFRGPAILLARLRCLAPERASVFHYLSFPAKLASDFRALLHARDPRALWLLGYWLALLRPFREVWWAGGRVARDTAAIRLWLGRLSLGERAGEMQSAWHEIMAELDEMLGISSDGY